MRGMKKYILLGLGILLFSGIVFTKSGKTASALTAQQIDVDGVPVVRLSDAARGIEVSILPALGNMAYEIKVHGKK